LTSQASHIDQLKIRSAFTEHPKQNYKHLTPGMGGQDFPANLEWQSYSLKNGLCHWLFEATLYKLRI